MRRVRGFVLLALLQLPWSAGVGVEEVELVQAAEHVVVVVVVVHIREVC